MSERLRLFVAAAPGLEELLLEEVEALGIEEARAVPGGVSCFGDFADVYRLNLGCSLGLRVLIRVGEFFVRDFRKLERVARDIEWERWLDWGMGVRVRAHAKRSRLYHTGGIAERVERGIFARSRGEAVFCVDGEAEGPGGGDHGPTGFEPVLVQVRIIRDRCTISIDTTGSLLPKRGWRPEGAKAPLREDLACALLKASSWRPGVALVDPMVGSGTLLIEAATRSRGWPANHLRRFGFARAPYYDSRRFEAERRALSAGEGPVAGAFVGFDRDAGAIEIARRNAARAQLGDALELAQGSIGSLDGSAVATAVGGAESVLIVANPPWGRRVGDPSRLRNLYASLGQFAARLSDALDGRELGLAMVTPEPKLAHATGLALERRATVKMGSVEVGLWVCDALGSGRRA